MQLNPRRRATGKFLSSPRTLHAAVESCFPPHYQDENPRILWRLERVGHEATLWMVSEKVPSFEPLQEQAGWENAVTWETRDYDQLLNRLLAGQRYRFRLTVNPVMEKFCDDDKKRRVALFREEDQIDWLLRRADQLGIKLTTADDDAKPTFAVRESRSMRFRHEKRTVTLQRCTFEGALEVTDPELLRKALVGGIGKAKAYGFGLLTLAPYNES
ncbi:type I-E CRISPR-associated protein Cas6/Cse3/CasE [Corynebacterium phocae]|nr:type I-E CRISPR-associated protein Cas6/Cse3/CasE [Corynebacterium phocae]